MQSIIILSNSNVKNYNWEFPLCRNTVAMLGKYRKCFKNSDIHNKSIIHIAGVKNMGYLQLMCNLFINENVR
jgi:hypothetical protein